MRARRPPFAASTAAFVRKVWHRSARRGNALWRLRESRRLGCGLPHCRQARHRAWSAGSRKERPVDSIAILAATAGAYLLAGFVKGVIGLGLPTVAIGLLGLMMTPSQAAAILVVPSLVTNIWQLAAGGELRALVRRLWPILAGICVGTFIGIVLLPNGSPPQATVWLGVALVIYAGLGLIKVQFFVPPRAERWIGLAVGIATGAASVATGIFVLPGVPYI